MEGARDSRYTKAAAGREMKRPASVLKRPSSSEVIKRPAGAAVAPAQPRLKSRFEAIYYNGARIYWGGDNRYRVLTNHKKATKNFKWNTVKEASKVWSDLIAFIDEHASV